MRSLSIALALVPALAQIPEAAAQTAGNVIFSQYYECAIGMEPILDQTVMREIAPLYDRHVESGDLINWGFQAHSIGGKWRRLAFMTAPDAATALRTRNAIVQAVNAEATAAGSLVNQICPTHEDYIWGIVQASQAAQAPTPSNPPRLLSMYYTCSPALEAEADDVVRAGVAPVLEELVRGGRLRSWSWLAHQTGGEFRRSLVFQGESQIELLDARGELIERLQGSDHLARLSEICDSHVDYHWNPVTAN